MKHLYSLVSTAQTLRHAFLRTPGRQLCLLQRHQFLRRELQPRLLHYSRSRKILGSEPAESNIIQNEDIEAEMIQLVNENNSLDQPVYTVNILDSLDRKEFTLVQVSPGDIDRPPVCKILSKRMMREQERERAKAAQAAKTALKQMELNWAVDPHDLSHRLKQLASFIDKGKKVEIILTRKKRKRAPTEEEVRHLMDAVMKTIKDANASQIKPMEGLPGKYVLITVKKKGT